MHGYAEYDMEVNECPDTHVEGRPRRARDEPRRRILLVEDQALIAMSEQMMLERAGYEVTVACSGRAAIEAFRSDPGIDLVLMDVDLGAGMDGTEAAQVILSGDEVPVVFLSSHTEPEVVERTEKITSYGYIVKSSGETVLLASIRMAFRLFEARIAERQALQRLNHSRDLMRHIIAHARSAIAVHDRNLNYLYVSDEYLNSYDITSPDVIGRHHYDVFPDLPQKWRDVHQRSLRGEIVSAEDDVFERADGRRLWTRWECRPWYENDGTIGGIVINTEVTDRTQRLQRILADNRGFLSALLSSTFDGVCVLDSRGRLLEVNHAFETMTGFSQDELTSMAIWDVDANDDEAAVARRFHRIQEQERLEFSTSFCRSNGTRIAVRVSAAAIPGEPTTYLGVVLPVNGAIMDELLDGGAHRESGCDERPGGAVHVAPGRVDQHYLKTELYRQVQCDPMIFEFLQSGSLDGIWYWDLEHPDREWMSPRFWQAFGYDPAEKRHDPAEWQSIIHPDDLEVAKRNLEMHLADPSHKYDQVVRYRHRNGGTVWVRCRGIAIRDEAGKPVRVLGAHNDVTEQMRALDEANTLRREMNHRVKNGFALLRSLVSLKSAYVEDPGVFSDLEHQIDTLCAVHEMLQESERDAEIEVGPFLERVVSGVFDAGSRPGTSVEVECDELTLDSRVAVPIGLIVNELATNALKHGFRDRETGRLRVGLQAESAGPRSCVLNVSNDGRPMPDDVDLRTESSLGLRLINALVTQIDATMSVATTPVTSFTITIPLPEPEDQPGRERVEPHPRPGTTGATAPAR